MHKTIKFHGTIKVLRYEGNDRQETTDIYADYFQAKSIQSAKAHLTKLANGQELFSWVQSWDGEKRSYTGKDLRWKPWLVPPMCYEQDDGTPIGYSYRRSEKEFGGSLYNGSRYGKSVGYIVEFTLHWNPNHIPAEEV